MEDKKICRYRFCLELSISFFFLNKNIKNNIGVTRILNFVIKFQELNSDEIIFSITFESSDCNPAPLCENNNLIKSEM